MSYTNQMDHALLDRQLIRELLLQLAGSTVKTSPGPLDRAEHLRRLRALCESHLEREWLDFLEEQNLRLPDAAQKLIEACHTRVDFFYGSHGVAVFVDGPDHEQPDVAGHDAEVADCLGDRGYTVIRFGYRRDSWMELVADHKYALGHS
jgi:very-short-patch-repair endonuclease